MTTRDTETADGVRWTLAEAMIGTDEERDADTVAVVATPSGGEQSVRLDLDLDWLDADASTLAQSIESARDDSPA